MISRSTGNNSSGSGWLNGSKLTPIFGGLKLIKDIRWQQFLRIILNHIKKNPEKLAAWRWLATTLQNLKVNWDMFFLQCQVLHRLRTCLKMCYPMVSPVKQAISMGKWWQRTKDTALIAVEQQDSSRNLMYFSLVARFFIFRKIGGNWKLFDLPCATSI